MALRRCERRDHNELEMAGLRFPRLDENRSWRPFVEAGRTHAEALVKARNSRTSSQPNTPQAGRRRRMIPCADGRIFSGGGRKLHAVVHELRAQPT
jgi:hypothetical protein